MGAKTRKIVERLPKEDKGKHQYNLRKRSKKPKIKMNAKNVKKMRLKKTKLIKKAPKATKMIPKSPKQQKVTLRSQTSNKSKPTNNKRSNRKKR